MAAIDLWNDFMKRWHDQVGDSFPFTTTQRICYEVLPLYDMWLPQALTDENYVALQWDTARYHLYIEISEHEASWFALDLETRESHLETFTFPIASALVGWFSLLKKDKGYGA